VLQRITNIHQMSRVCVLWHNGGMADARYEDRFSRAGRLGRRLARGMRWRLKGASGRPRNLLVELRWRLGDEIMSLPVLVALKRAYPDCRLHLLTNFPDLFAEHPAIDAVNVIPGTVDRYLFLRDAPRTVRRIEVYARLAGVPVPADRPRLELIGRALPDSIARPAGPGPLVAVSPGASWPIKRWPMAHWRDLCAALRERGVRVVELGHGDDCIGGIPSLMNRTTVQEAACVLRRADLFIGCDSGLMHLALAVDTPVLALFGPTDPDILIQAAPLFHPLRSGLPCRGFWNRPDHTGPPGVCPLGHESCLEDITAGRVLDAALELLERD
jgi:ADP-heptose:LPS heptosyltransferase